MIFQAKLGGKQGLTFVLTYLKELPGYPRGFTHSVDCYNPDIYGIKGFRGSEKGFYKKLDEICDDESQLVMFKYFEQNGDLVFGEIDCSLEDLKGLRFAVC